MWKDILTRKCDNIDKYPNLRLIVNAIRSLPHSNADPERSFSILSNLKCKEKSRLSSTSVNAICVFKSALKARKETALNMSITDRHLKLMDSKILYATPNKKQKSCLTLYSAECDNATPSSFNDTQ